MRLFNLNYWQVISEIIKSVFYWFYIIIKSGWPLFLIIGIVLLILFYLSYKIPRRGKYQYELRDSIMTKSELEFFKVLLLAVGEKYNIFPQIHLDAFLNYKIIGQNWFGAFHHINQNSIDFLLCDKTNTKPVLAIELDDRSHERGDRVERDGKVEHILKEANLILLRIKDDHNFTVEEVSKKVFNALSQVNILK